MRRFQWALLVVLMPLLAVSVTLSGCKKPDDTSNVNDDGSFGGGGGGGGGKVAGAKMTGIKMGNGVIKGKVILKGSKPDLEKMNADLLAQIKEKKPDDKVCLAGTPEEIHQQHYRIGPDNTVGNVFVFVMPVDNRGSYFEFSKEDIAKLKVPMLVKIDQPHCAFEPHVDLAFPDYADPKNPKKMIPTGQVVDIVNDATISHNTKWDEVGRITSGNQLLPPGGKPLALPLAPTSEPLRISCSIHPWMDGFIWPLSHPYADITKSPTSPAKIKPDDPSYGTYEIKNVPTGVKLKLIAWHEEARYLTPDKKMDSAPEIELKDGETLTKDFEMEAPK